MFQNVNFRHFGGLKISISAQSLTGLIKSTILVTLVLGLEIIVNTPVFSMETQFARVVLKDYQI